MMAGCSVDETLRMVKSIRKVDSAKGTAFTPADWDQGQRIIHNSMGGLDAYYRSQAAIIGRISGPMAWDLPPSIFHQSTPPWSTRPPDQQVKTTSHMASYRYGYSSRYSKKQ
jgi:hypothetical protein